MTAAAAAVCTLVEGDSCSIDSARNYISIIQQQGDPCCPGSPDLSDKLALMYFVIVVVFSYCPLITFPCSVYTCYAQEAAE